MTAFISAVIGLAYIGGGSTCTCPFEITFHGLAPSATLGLPPPGRPQLSRPCQACPSPGHRKRRAKGGAIQRVSGLGLLYLTPPTTARKLCCPSQSADDRILREREQSDSFFSPCHHRLDMQKNSWGLDLCLVSSAARRSGACTRILPIHNEKRAPASVRTADNGLFIAHLFRKQRCSWRKISNHSPRTTVPSTLPRDCRGKI